jgi:hypothetical protein
VATGDDRAVFMDTSGSSRVLTLPAADAIGAGRTQMLLVARTETDTANQLTVQVTGSDQIRAEGASVSSLGVVSDLFFSDGLDTWEKL